MARHCRWQEGRCCLLLITELTSLSWSPRLLPEARGSGGRWLRSMAKEGPGGLAGARGVRLVNGMGLQGLPGAPWGTGCRTSSLGVDCLRPERGARKFWNRVCDWGSDPMLGEVAGRARDPPGNSHGL